MGRLVILTLTCSIMLIATFNVAVANDVGINWSRNSRLKLLPSNIVDMILSDGIKKVRLHSFVGSVARAFTGSGLEMITTVSNIDMILVNSTRKAQAYVAENVTKAYTKLDLNVKTIVVGNEPFTIVDNITRIYQDDVVNAIGYISEALTKQPSPINQIKATMAHAPDVLLPNIQKPSDADFNDDVNDRMGRILKVLNASGAPLAINMYPHLHILEKNFPLDFAFFDGNSTFSVKDGANEYTNIFDFIYDSFVWALRKNGFGNMKIIVTQIGWPTDGHQYANASTAERFFNGFLKKMSKDEGTPLLRGEPIETFIYNLNDENMRDITFRGPSIRHYGLYDFKGTPKFHMDLTMSNNSKGAKLAPAQGVVAMPNRWCVYDKDAKTKDQNRTAVLLEQFNFACSRSDCTKLMYGGSLNNLTFEGNISYAFNDYFQANNQLEGSCDFKGLGKITVQDPSNTYQCNFPLQIIAMIYSWGQGEMGNILATRGANAVVSKTSGAFLIKVSGFSTIVVPLLLSALLL
ncbi:glucan endo-1,3-beta-glucosidase 8-like [Apium graveolens]|uniref:glucan endo-1,3-beta-glucosidase 8-like n=1 Tax=Apium graveolens TaxID=4045 RepID=UPI003D78F527